MSYDIRQVEVNETAGHIFVSVGCPILLWKVLLGGFVAVWGGTNGSLGFEGVAV